MDENEQQTTERSELERYANVPPSGRLRALAPAEAPAEVTRYVGAQPVARRRVLGEVQREVKQLAAMAGNDWFYRYPVREKKTGTTKWVEGPSIKLANAVLLIYGNCSTDIEVVDYGDSWLFRATFTDLEKGVETRRLYTQRKSQDTMRGRDPQRALDIVFQIGQSKAIRNVICNALQVLTGYAFEEAHKSLRDRIGKNLEGSRERALELLADVGVDFHRVEQQFTRAAKDWTAPDLARIVAMAQAVRDGMATAEETFTAHVDTEAPASGTSEPAAVVATPRTGAAAPPGDPGSSPPDTPPGKPVGPTSEPDEPKLPPERPRSAPINKQQYLELVHATCAAADDAEGLRAWFTSAAQRKLRQQIGMSVSVDTKEAGAIVDERLRELEQGDGDGDDGRE